MQAVKISTGGSGGIRQKQKRVRVSAFDLMPRQDSREGAITCIEQEEVASGQAANEVTSIENRMKEEDSELTKSKAEMNNSPSLSLSHEDAVVLPRLSQAKAEDEGRTSAPPNGRATCASETSEATTDSLHVAGESKDSECLSSSRNHSESDRGFAIAGLPHS